MSKKTVEQIYQKKTQHEHILTRPDMYIGTIEPVTDEIWVFDEADNIMKLRRCTWIPGLYKIFDEILVNAADNKIRDPDGQTQIKVTIDEGAGFVKIWNNGEGIPVQRHKDHDLWVPEMIFGHLLTSSNYDDTEAKVTGGRNGFGAKLTNVFSERFEVETGHSRSRKKFSMKWTKNMLGPGTPNISPFEGSDYTCVTFYPDFSKFGVPGFSEDMVLLMKRRVYDIAGTTDRSLKCYLNGTKLPICCFAEYVDLYPTLGEEKKAASFNRVNDRWEVCIRVSNIGFQQVSFVNSIATSRGGNHVKYLTDQVIAKVTETAKKKNKGLDVKPHMIKPHLFIFINCLIENPSFDSQTKETLNTTKARFGSSCELPQSMIDYILKSGIVERTVQMANSKLTQEMASKLKNSDRRQILGIPKLDDANEAGGKQGFRCTLIVTEGDSAKTLCTAGLAVKDRDFFGVFPLRGKPLNVRDASLKKVMSCEEIQSVMKIMGLDIRQKYTSTESLRYGHLMIMSDQDYDGSHIKGLIINFVHHYWPNLLEIPGFLQQFITPIVKAREKGRDGRTISFFAMPHYLEWKKKLSAEQIAKYDIRYYKGLGTSGAKEGREYFENIDRHRLDFVRTNQRDDERIVMAFAKDKVDERKEWITNFRTNVNVNETMDYTVKKVSFADFVDKELILFSVADCERSIPSVIDGLKPGQRKIIFSCFKRNLSRSIKVVQLAGYVSEHSAYHHGEASLVSTIVGLAQDFVGSNNVPLLHQDGQFGTRLQGGKDHAAGRYIFTRLAAVARMIFHKGDDFTVEYRDDDGLSVEPFYYVPIIPMVLVNGTSGIGTGFATNIPSYSPLEIIDNLRRLIRGEEPQPMKPWYFGFTGTIEEKAAQEKGKFVSRGIMQVREDGVIAVSELPIGTWTQQYKKFLEDLREKEIVVQYREHNTDVTVDFEILLHPEVFRQWNSQGLLEEKLQLREYIHATNIIAFNTQGQLTKYADAEAVMKEFYLVRLEHYGKRKEYMLGEMRRTVQKLANMARFIGEVISGTIVVTRRKKKELLDELKAKRYDPFPPQTKKKVSSTTVEEAEAEQPDGGEEDVMAQLSRDVEGADPPEVLRATKDYDYLVGMKLWSLTAEMVARLQEQLKKSQSELEALEARPLRDLWLEDLAALEKSIKKTFADREAEVAGVLKKKLEKKKRFDGTRVKIPILSDKAKSVLANDKRGLAGVGKATRATGEGVDGDGAKPAAKKAKPKKKKKKGSDDDDDDSFDFSSGADDDDGGDSDVPLAKRVAAVPKPKPKVEKKAAAPRQAAPKKPTAPKKKKGSDDDDDDDDDSGSSEDSSSNSSASDESSASSSSTDSGKKKKRPAAPSKRAGSSTAPKPAAKRRVEQSPTTSKPAEDEFDIESFGLKPSNPVPAVRAAKPATVPKPLVDDDDEEWMLLGVTAPPSKKPDPASKPKPKSTARNSPAAKKKAAPKKRRRGSSDDDDDDDDDDSSDDYTFD
jgi:DNA topoisomerase-2